MKHVRTMTKSPVARAQMSTSEILALVGTILSTLGAALLAISPVVAKGD